MAMEFRLTSSGSWVAEVGELRCYWQSENEPDQASRSLAEAIVSSIDNYLVKAGDYLDLFVDRAKASGRPDEQWHFIEIEIGRQHVDGRPFASLAFDLFGDDGGYWTVDFRSTHSGIRPYQLRRTQG